MPDEPLNNEQIEPSSSLPINTMGSEPSNMPPEAPESPINTDIPASLNNDNPENTPIYTPSPEELKSEEIPAEGGKTEEILKTTEASENGTAQMVGNDPLKSESQPLSDPAQTKAEATPPPAMQTSRNRVFELLSKAKDAIQFRKRKKLDRIMTLFLKNSKITNDEVEKFLHVSDATATRYLSQLEKEGKIKQSGKTGKGVSYSRI